MSQEIIKIDTQKNEALRAKARSFSRFLRRNPAPLIRGLKAAVFGRRDKKCGQTPLEILRPAKRSKFLTGQTTLEFTFCLLILVILFIAAFLVFKWAGVTLVSRQQNFEASRASRVVPPRDFYTAPDMNLTVNLTH